MAKTVVRITNLHRRYGSVRAVNGIDLEIFEGEVFALLGPNGAGKTTTVEILEGYRRRDCGEAMVLGADPATASAEWRRRIGIVLQAASDVPELTVEESLRHFAGYFPDPWDQAELMSRVGLNEVADRRVRTLSGGERRRLDVAIGLVGRPELLFLDEPTTGFDPRARRAFWDLLRDVRAESGTTILLTTHYLDEAEALADRVAIVAAGRVVAVGDPATLGGRNSGQATVTWTAGGKVRTEQVDDPGAFVTALTARSGTSAVSGLSVSRPSLEDVYLQLIEEEHS